MNYKNKIFINALSAKLGGGITYIENLLQYIDYIDSEIYIITSGKFKIPNSNKIKEVKSRFARKNIFYRFVWELFYLPFFLFKNKINVLFVPGGLDLTLFTYKSKKVTMFRNMLPFDKKIIDKISGIKFKNYILKRLMLITMRSSDGIIFISSYAKKIINKEIDLSNAIIINHGISKNFVPRRLNIKKNNNRYLLYVSRFEPYKNHLNLIKAYHSLPSDIKKIYRLVIVGEFMEPTFSNCLDYVKNNGLDELVIFKGKVTYSALPDLYRNCELFIFPSSCENCPNILLEAIGCGAPVIVSKTNPMPEFAKDAALYIDEHNTKDIEKKILTVLSSPNLLHSMREKSISLRNEYLWENTAKKTWNYLISIGNKNV